jgi:hypothetical protein
MITKPKPRDRPLRWSCSTHTLRGCRRSVAAHADAVHASASPLRVHAAGRLAPLTARSSKLAACAPLAAAARSMGRGRLPRGAHPDGRMRARPCSVASRASHLHDGSLLHASQLREVPLQRSLPAISHPTIRSAQPVRAPPVSARSTRDEASHDALSGLRPLPVAAIAHHTCDRMAIGYGGLGGLAKRRVSSHLVV